MTPTQALAMLDAILGHLARLRAAFHDPLNRADLTEAQACLEDVALRLQEDVAQAGRQAQETPQTVTCPDCGGMPDSGPCRQIKEAP